MSDPLRDANAHGAWRVFAQIIRGFSFVAALAIFVMIVTVCLDVVLRRVGLPIAGAYDIVRVCGAVAIACILPATSAAKGHISIEYFFHKFGRRTRKVIDVLVHGGMALALAVASVKCVESGFTLLRSGECTDTLQIPLFWIPWAISAGCLLSSAVSIFHLTHHGKEMMRI